MIEKRITIINKLGLHARAASRFVTLASGFASEIQLAKNGQVINGKSIMGVMMLAASKGTVLEMTVSGEDEDEAASRLERLVLDRFGEDE
ncbi:MAG: HPr family phosphocarrier protein [Gammaproteobacteria bacterium]|nr:HPr family phosphocarrier protein [Gammaproteobacteria bacterium]MDD9807397.1 HPr family phosphocarrier protein [Gammaproteobacteria bacterium]